MDRPSDRWVAIALAVLLHVVLLAALTYGWWKFRRPTQPAPTLAIEATVVDARSVAGPTRPAPAPQPVPPPPQPQEADGPPPPTPEELARREHEQRQAVEQAAAQKAQAEKQRLEKQRLEEQQAEERAAQEKAATQKAALAQQAEEKRKAEAQRQAEAADKSEREADLKRSLAAEKRVNTAASMSALASWKSQITAKITRAWLRPPTARAGLECNLYVTQVPGGEVTQVRVGECNGDQAVRESIEAAVYRASPLPPPADPALFDRDLKITFKPDLD
jgi:colicin import membrane protein